MNNQNTYELTLTIIEFINLGITVIFLALFSHRCYKLKHYSESSLYIQYYPKLNLVLCCLYAISSVGLLTYNLIRKQNKDIWVVIKEDGVGECINSIILGIHVYVLYLQLQKQQKYCKLHRFYLFYVVFISLLRVSILIFDMIINCLQCQIVNMSISACLAVIAVIQTVTWFYYLNSLPIFMSAEELWKKQQKMKLLSKTHVSLRKQTLRHSLTNNFAYIEPTVIVQRGKLKIILQCEMKNQLILSSEQSQTNQRVNNRLSQNSSKKVKKEPKTGDTSTHVQIMSEVNFNLVQAKQLYKICGKFPLGIQMRFQSQQLKQLSDCFTELLQKLFSDKKYYHSDVLKYLQVPKELISQYQQTLINQDDFVNFNYGIDSQVDKCANYISIEVYRHLLVDDHYQFYIKALITAQDHIKSFVSHRFSEFQEFDIKIRSIADKKSKKNHFKIEIPSMPKKHSLGWNEQSILKRRSQLELYLCKLCNDRIIITNPKLKEVILQFLNLEKPITVLPAERSDPFINLEIRKGNIDKELTNHEYVTYYEFKLFKSAIQIKQIRKRFNDFVVLHKDLCRWMNNIQVTYKMIELPEKNFYHSEQKRYQRLQNYLQNIIQIKQSHKVYELICFFDFYQHRNPNSQTNQSALSSIGRGGNQFHYSSIRNWNIFESSENNCKKEKRISELIDQLGKEDSQYI